MQESSGTIVNEDAWGMHTYRIRVPGEGMQDVVSILPKEVAFEKGLPSEAIVGRLLKPSHEGGTLTPDNFTGNNVFVDFMHEVIGRIGPDLPGLIAEAKRLGSGHVYVIDGRTPTPGDRVPASDTEPSE